MYLKPIRIFRLDGKVVRPRKKLLIDVTESEAFNLRKRRHAMLIKDINVLKDTVIIKSKALENESKSKNAGSVSGVADSKRGNVSKDKRNNKVSKSK